MDDFTLGKKLFGKEATAEQKTASANPSSASIVEMIAVTASHGGEVVVRNADEDADEIWETGEPGVDYIELDEDGDYEEEAYDNADDLEDVDDGALDMTDGDGADIEGSQAESVAFTVEAYHEAAVAAAEEEAGQEDDALAGEEDYVTDDTDDGDASDAEDPGDPSLEDQVPGEYDEAADMTDDEFTAADDNDPDESEEPLAGVELSDGSTVVETTVSVKEGDRVLVSIQDGRMAVIGVVGGGDEANAQTALAQETADEANAAALEAAEDAAAATEAASNAQAKAEEADAAANAAQGAAQEAQNAANQAATEANEAMQKANEAQEKAVLVENNMAGINAEVADIKADAAQMRQDMLTSGDIETVRSEISQSFATKTELSEAETTLRKYTEDSVAETKTTFSQDYAKKTDVEGAIVTAKADLQTQITQNAGEIASVAKSVEAVEVDITENATKVQEAQAAANAAQSTADAAKTDASQAAAAASSAQAAADQARANATTAQNAADAAAAELATAKAKLAEVEGNANATAEDLAAAQEAVRVAQGAADEAAADAANAKAAADTAQGTANTAKENAAKAQTAADDAQKAANEAKADLAALTTRVTKAETSIKQNSDAITLNATRTEEVATDLAENHYTKAQTDAQIKVSADNITSTVSKKIDDNAAAISTLTQTAESLTGRVQSAEGNISTLTQTASGLSVRLETAEKDVDAAQSTANTAKTNAATAQSTANAANNAASAAQTTANSASSAAGTAQSTANTARTEAANAAKTATNYLGFSNDGLVVGDMTKSALGKNVLIDSDSVDIRDGSTALARFEGSKISLGLNRADSTIDLCAGVGNITAVEIDDNRRRLSVNGEDSLGLFSKGSIGLTSDTDQENAENPWPYAYSDLYVDAMDSFSGTPEAAISMNAWYYETEGDGKDAALAIYNKGNPYVRMNAGDNFMTMYEDRAVFTRAVQSEYNDVAFSHTHATSGVQCGFGVGSGGTNHGVYSNTMKGWLVYGNGTDLRLFSPGGAYKPYFSKGDSFTVALRAAGYVTNSSKEVTFLLPLAKPVVGSPTVTASSPNDGLIIRQGGSYTHGSTASAFKKPDSYNAVLQANCGVVITATFSTTTNATNNDACGVYWSGTITFS